jgi:threonine/homoserine/homoserine lactone efflux protein
LTGPRFWAFFSVYVAGVVIPGPNFVAPGHVSVGTFAAMLGMVCVVASSWYGFVALTLSHERIATAYRRCKAWIDRVCGGLIVALGVRQLIR